MAECRADAALVLKAAADAVGLGRNNVREDAVKHGGVTKEPNALLHLLVAADLQQDGCYGLYISGLYSYHKA